MRMSMDLDYGKMSITNETSIITCFVFYQGWEEGEDLEG